MAKTLTQDALFVGEYRQEMEAWLRRRLRLLCLLLFIVTAVSPLLFLFVAPADRPPNTLLVTAVSTALWLLILWYFGIARSGSGADRRQLLGNATMMLFLLGIVETLTFLAYYSLTASEPIPLLLTLFIMHVLACAILPWTGRESLVPFSGLFVLWAALALAVRQDIPFLDRIVVVVLAPAIFLPGLAICTWRLRRHSRKFSTRMVDRSFTAMRSEFHRARAIHESMFPKPYDDGFVGFHYCYTPMAELGGDFIHLCVGAEGLVYLTLIDVTGHGLAAALTVNRLYGELERIRGESPRAEPDEVITLLNRYVHLTMSRHNVYATAICVMIDPYLGRLAWASGGHNPAILRGANGRLRELDSTAIMLGAVPDAQYDADQKEFELSPSDMVLLFTDGAVEARDRNGDQFGIDRLRQLLRRTPAPRNWPQFIASTVEKHHAGRVEDDVLVATLTLHAMRTGAEGAASERATAQVSEQ